jgi:hypothetical protein
MFVGDTGILLADYGKRILLPEADFKDFQPPMPSITPLAGTSRGMDPCLQDRCADTL